jgi:hypothetical protein
MAPRSSTTGSIAIKNVIQTVFKKVPPAFTLFWSICDLFCCAIVTYPHMMRNHFRESFSFSIRAQFDGRNYRALAAEFRLSEQQIQKSSRGTKHNLGQASHEACLRSTTKCGIPGQEMLKVKNNLQ